MLRVLALVFCLSNISAMAQEQPDPVPDLDLSRYAGTWYEVARLPNRFQDRCIGDVTATYELRDDGAVTVINRCMKANGMMTEVVGRARKAERDGPTSKLEVRFAPGWLGWLPFVWADYWVLHLSPGYDLAIVGGPSRKYLWILSRTPTVDETTMQELMGKAAAQGYAVNDLVRTVNTGG
jgi:apolipoprotein D and lipocalin family protein